MADKKKNKEKKKLDKMRKGRPYPNPIFTNYDYGTSEGPSETSPGGGLYSNMHKYKSVKDFVEKNRKERAKIRKRKEALAELIKVI